MSKLLYNSSSDIIVTRDDMSYLKTPEPMGSRHAPYSFADFSNTVCDEIVKSGFKIEREEFAITQDENRLFGLVHVSNGVDDATPEIEYNIVYPENRWITEDVIRMKYADAVANGAVDYTDLTNVDEIVDELSSAGLVTFATSRRHSACVGETLPAIYKPEHNSVVGVRGAHDQRFSRGVAIGSQVMCCSNLCFHGDLGNWFTRQTTNIAARIPGLVADAVGGLRDASETLTVDFDAFNRREITRDAGDSILLDIYRSGGFSASQLGRAIGDWDECSVAEHTANGRTLWWLFNSATAALKPTGLNTNHNDLRERSTIVYRKVAQHNRLALAA